MNEELKTIEHLKETAGTLAIQSGPRVLVAIVLIVAGVVVGQWIGRIADRGLSQFHLEPPVRHLLVRIVRALVLGLFAIMALQNLGVELLPLIAGLGVAGAGVALAMQGVLGNLMAGLTIIFTKPFRVGEYVSIAGEEGAVQSISLSTTILSHPDLSQVVIPNRKIVGEILHNYGKVRQLEIVIGIGRDTDLDSALSAMAAVLRDNPRCLRDPIPVVTVSGFADGAICITARPWVTVSDYSAAASEIRKAIVESFRARNIVVPPPLQEVRVVGPSL
jgi:small conductance mechanosensitive channel